MMMKIIISPTIISTLAAKMSAFLIYLSFLWASSAAHK
jgi:hypothetical protein